MKSLRVIALLLAVAACVALAGAALASKGSKPARQLPQSTKVLKENPLAKPASTSGQRAGDTDNVQSGDQTTLDESHQQSSESESTGDNEPGQAGEPAQGHEDPAGQDANHECTGNCQE